MTAPVDRWRPSHRGVALTAAGIAAVVCLVGWPRPTLYVTGLITGAVVLLVGLRTLAAERGRTDQTPTRVEIDPNMRTRLNHTITGLNDADGPLHAGQFVEVYEPESGLTGRGRVVSVDPMKELVELAVDWTSLRPADAILRDRIAKALREHGMVHLGDQVPADEYDCCADTALAVVQPELDRLADQSGTCDASEVIDIGFFGHPHAFGPCILRQGHAGPVHKAANGAQWRPTNQPDAALTPPAVAPCPTGCAVPTGVHHRHIKPADQPDH